MHHDMMMCFVEMCNSHHGNQQCINYASNAIGAKKKKKKSGAKIYSEYAGHVIAFIHVEPAPLPGII